MASQSRCAPEQILNFDGKSVLVTGASQGIGSAIAERFAMAGANVLGHYRSNRVGIEDLIDRSRSWRGTVQAVSAELSERSQVEGLFDTVVDCFGRLDVLVNNAGIYPNCELVSMTDEEWHGMFSANLDSVMLCTQAAAKRMKLAGSGVVVNIASISGMNPAAEHSHYNTSKAAVLMFTSSAAQELGRYGIRVNAVSPGLISRAGIDDAWPDGVARWKKSSPLARLGDPRDVADACLFLASDGAQWITGVNLPVEGGVMSAMIY